MRETLSTSEVASKYGIPEATLRWWRHINSGPASFKIGRRVHYRCEEIDRWIAAQEAATIRGEVFM